MILQKGFFFRITTWIATKLGLLLDFGEQWTIGPVNNDELTDQLHYGRDG